MIVCCLWHFFPVPIAVCVCKSNRAMHSNCKLQLHVHWTFQAKMCIGRYRKSLEQHFNGGIWDVNACRQTSIERALFGKSLSLLFAAANFHLSGGHILTQCKWPASAARLMVRLRRHWNRNNFTRLYTYISLSWDRAPFDFVSLRFMSPDEIIYTFSWTEYENSVSISINSGSHSRSGATSVCDDAIVFVQFPIIHSAIFNLNGTNLWVGIW